MALEGAFALITQLQSDIESGNGRLESRLILLDNQYKTLQKKNKKRLTDLVESSSSRVNSLEGNVTAASALASDLPILFNNTKESFVLL